jgi:hypothetical protein
MGFVRVEVAHDKAAPMKIDQGVARRRGPRCGVWPHNVNRDLTRDTVGLAVDDARFNLAFGQFGLGIKKAAYIFGTLSADGAAMGF